MAKDVLKVTLVHIMAFCQGEWNPSIKHKKVINIVCKLQSHYDLIASWNNQLARHTLNSGLERHKWE